MTSPMMKQHERFDWSFGSIPTATAESRQAHALEYIAYYLDRIEGHIAKISKTSTDNLAGDITALGTLKNVLETKKKQT